MRSAGLIYTYSYDTAPPLSFASRLIFIGRLSAVRSAYSSVSDKFMKRDPLITTQRLGREPVWYRRIVVGVG